MPFIDMVNCFLFVYNNFLFDSVEILSMQPYYANLDLFTFSSDSGDRNTS